MKTMAWIGATLLALGGCATTPVPADSLARSQAAFRSAHEVGAENVPPAALHLTIAKEELDQAKRLIKDGEYKRAEYILMRAESDANAALALTREADARTDAQKTIEQVQKLKTSRPEGS